MKHPRTRLLVTMAASDVSLGELNRFLRWLEEIGPDRVTLTIENIRRDLARLDDISLGSPRHLQKTHERSPNNKAASERLERMLLTETGLSKNQAMELLHRQIREEFGPTKALPPYNKISFSKWLERLSQRFGADAMLQIASRIRNNIVHRTNTDWPLRRD